ncbi:MAG: hypothetical protein DWQ37_02845 [Planctomycetota bacterium]|nr:MAG: hypothetical protein DWQ37_02845 [Planctomycetota bacterium]
MSEQIVPVKTYAGVLAALLVLLVATVAAGLIEGPGLGITTALSIATVKAVLIVLFFMHVRHGSPIVRLAAVAGFLWLALLIGLSMTDLLTRDGPPATDIPAGSAPDASLGANSSPTGPKMVEQLASFSPRNEASSQSLIATGTKIIDAAITTQGAADRGQARAVR